MKNMLGKLARSSLAASFGVNDDLSAALAVTAILELVLIIVTLIVKVFNLFVTRGHKHFNRDLNPCFLLDRKRIILQYM